MAKTGRDCPDLKSVVAMDGGRASWPSYEAWRDAQKTVDPMLPVAADDDVIQLPIPSGTMGHLAEVLTSANYLAVFNCSGNARQPENI